MATLETASQEELRRMLELFPATVLREQFGAGDKTDICDAAATRRDNGQLATFLGRNFGRCKQHVFVLGDSTLDVPISIAFEDADLVAMDPEARSIFLAKVSYTVYVKDPFEAVSVNFLWPIRVEKRKGFQVVSFIVLERDPRPFANRSVITAVRHVDEKQTVRALNDLGFLPVDLNKGVKALWAQDLMDAFRVRFKKPFSTATEVMDEELGIKQTNPQLYEEVQRLPLFDTLFRVRPSRDSSVRSFNVNPTTGKIAFTSYTDDAGDTDELVTAILAANE